MARATRTRTRLDPEVRREQILDAAEIVFVDREPGEVTLEQVAEAAGVSRALVHNYFRDKAGLVAAVCLRGFERLDAELAATPGYHGDDEDRLRALVDCHLRFARANPAAWRVTWTAEAIGHPEVQAARRARCERMAADWGGSAEARIAAHGVLGLLDAATLEWLDHDDLSFDGARAALLTLLWTGLAGFADAASGNESGPARRRPAPATRR